MIDEAQSLSPTLLDEVRMLTAFERDGKRLVQIILCGQPMLLNTLKTEPMYALNERITRRVVLDAALGRGGRGLHLSPARDCRRRETRSVSSRTRCG